MNTPYRCQNDKRRTAVRAARGPDGKPILNGIEFLEVSDDQRTLSVQFIHNLPGQPEGVPPAPALTPEQITIDGGVRIKNVRVDSVESNGNVLTVKVNQPGDFSTYTLRLVTSATEPAPPPGVDPQLSEIEFSFKATCPSEFDCQPNAAGSSQKLPEPSINYLARDYASFRRLMLDRLAVLSPQWQARNPADLGLALVEALAYAADRLSYYQDAVATEAYLGTARKRISVRRHARLLDYSLHEGGNARAWLCLEVAPGSSADGHTLPAGTPCLTQINAPPGLHPDQLAAALNEGSQAFETLHPLTLRPAHNRIAFYTWGNDACSLPRGVTRATLRDDKVNRLCLCPGDVLVIEEQRGPQTGLEADADPTHRHAIRLTRVHPAAQRTLENGVEMRTPGPLIADPLTGQPIVDIEWLPQDSLPFSLPLSALIEGEGLIEISVARGNVVLVDHGLTVRAEPLIPETVPPTGPHRPRLRHAGLTHRVPYVESLARPTPASALTRQDPHAALPAITLSEDANTWLPQRDLLNSDRFAREFVAEMENDGRAYLRFGDGLHGRRPPGGTRFVATYRIGNGQAGNVGAESIAHVVTRQLGVDMVRNPLPALGGIDPEPIERARLDAPQAFRIQERAVTEADYAAAAQRHRDVQKAVATRRWTGSWHTLFIAVDRRGGRPVDSAFEAELRAFLERFRLSAHDLEIEGPRFVSLDIAFTVCVAPGYFRSAVNAALLEVFSNVDLPDGRRGFFHPDNFTFGQSVYLSQVIAGAMRVPGVLWVDVDDKFPKRNRFRRWAQPSRGEVARGQIDLGRLEIGSLHNDPNAQENGKIEFYLEGGL